MNDPAAAASATADAATSSSAKSKQKKAKKPGLVRWGYVAPRLALLLIVVATVRFGLDSALRWAITSSGEAALGARVEIGDLDTALLSGELTLRDVAAANPSRPMRNLLSAQEAKLVIDVAELTRGRLLVTDGRVAGIRFDGERTTSGALPDVEPDEAEAGPSMFDPLVQAAEARGAAWLDNMSGRLEDDLKSSLQTPRVAKELEERWPKQYDELRAAVDALQAQGKQIETAFREARKNPLRNLDKLQQLAADLTKMHADAAALQKRLAELPQQAEADRQAVDAARRHDEQFLREHLKADTINGAQLSQYLLGEEAGGYLAATLRWIHRARALVPSKKPDVASQSRGVNVAFVDRPRPQLLVRQVELLGQARLHGQPLELAGLLTNLTNQPTLHEEPLQLQLSGSGALACTLDVTCDRRDETPRDSLQFACPQLPVPGRQLGKADKLAVSVAPSAAAVTAHLELVDDNVEGTIVFAQQATQLTASMAALGDARLDEALNKSLAAVDHFEANLVVAGTMQRPQLTLTSNLGPDLAAGFNGAFRDYLKEKADRTLAKAQDKVDQQLAKLEAKRQAAQQELLAKLGEHQELLAQVDALTGGQPPAGATLPGGIVLPGPLKGAATKIGGLSEKIKR